MYKKTKKDNKRVKGTKGTLQENIGYFERVKGTKVEKDVLCRTQVYS